MSGSIGELHGALEKSRKCGTVVEVGAHMNQEGSMMSFPALRYGYKPVGQFLLSAGGFKTRKEAFEHAREKGYSPEFVQLFSKSDHGF